MSITKETELLEVTVAANGVVFYEEATKIIEDGVEISRNNHRTVLNPSADLSTHPDMVKSIAAAAWTPEVIANYKAFLAEQEVKRAQQGAQA